MRRERARQFSFDQIVGQSPVCENDSRECEIRMRCDHLPQVLLDLIEVGYGVETSLGKQRFCFESLAAIEAPSENSLLLHCPDRATARRGRDRRGPRRNCRRPPSTSN